MYEQHIIGEGVILDSRPASFMSRGLGWLIDICVLFLVFLAIGRFTPLFEWMSSSAGSAFAIALLAFITVILPACIETLSRGRSLGKWAMGTQIIRDDGGPISARHAFIRASVGLGELWLTLGCVALFSSLFNNRGKRLGDFLAGTYAVRVRVPKRTRFTLQPTPALTPWVSQAEISKFPDGLALSARQFLSKAGSMHPGSRAATGNELVAALSRFVQPQPPFPVAPEDFIASVVAERARREIIVENRRSQRKNSLQHTLEKLPLGIENPEN